MRFRWILAGTAGLLFIPADALAQFGLPIVIGTGVRTGVGQIIAGLINALLAFSGLVSLTLFVLGAFIMTASGGEETYVTNGKKLMKAAIIGLIIVLASWMILSTVFYFIAV